MINSRLLNRTGWSIGWSRLFAEIRVTSLQALLSNELGLTAPDGKRFWHRFASDGWIRPHKGQFVELKAFAMMSRHISSRWVLRIDSDSVFVRPVQLARHVRDAFAKAPFTLVHNLPNGSCRGWPVPLNTSNEFLHLADARLFGYALSTFWLFETAAYARFAARVRASYSFKELVAWISARDGLGKGVNNLLMTEAYYRYLVNEDPRRHAYQCVEDDAVLSGGKLLRGACGFRIHVSDQLAHPKSRMAATAQIANAYRALNGHLPTWVTQGGCATPQLTAFNVGIINATPSIFLATIASGCQDTLRQVFHAPRARNGTAVTAHEHDRGAFGAWSTPAGRLHSWWARHWPARTHEDRVVDLLIPLHPNDLPKLHTLLWSAHDFLDDLENMTLHIIVTSDDEITVVRESLRGISRRMTPRLLAG